MKKNYVVLMKHRFGTVVETLGIFESYFCAIVFAQAYEEMCIVEGSEVDTVIREYEGD